MPWIKSQRAMTVALCAITFCLSACGGNGGSGASFVATPPPPPAPPPPPPLNPYPDILLRAHTGQSATFDVIGWEVGPDDTRIEDLTTSGFSVRYDATTNRYLIATPSTAEGVLRIDGVNTNFWSGTVDIAGDPQGAMGFSIRRTDNMNTYFPISTYAVRGVGEAGSSVFAFGEATLPGNVRLTGSAVHDLELEGFTLDQRYLVSGNGRLTFLFGTGELTGYLNTSLELIGSVGQTYSGGRYDVRDAVHAVGSETFTGLLLNSATNMSGAFNGIFIGPQGENLIGRFAADFKDPLADQTGTMFGVFIGRDVSGP